MGTTTSGGADGYGAVYKLDTTGRQTVLYSFTGGTDGSYPYAGLTSDSNGNFYGTTYEGGTAGCGVVYQWSATSGLTVLHSFTCATDGGFPMAGVIRDGAGNLYGTATSGGTTGGGVVFELSAAGEMTVLHSFAAARRSDSVFRCDPRCSGQFVWDYRVRRLGRGVVYKLDKTGLLTVLHSFTNGTDGGSPYGGVTLDAAGNLYGTTSSGGAGFLGTVYKLDTAGNFTVLCELESTGGGSSYSGVTRDSAGNLYGTTYGGGTGYGLVYKVDPAGNVINLSPSQARRTEDIPTPA